MFLILFSDINCDASGIIVNGLPEKSFIQGFGCIFVRFWKARLGVRCTNRFFEPCFSFTKATSFLYRFYVIPIIFFGKAVGFYLNYVGFKRY